MLARFQHMVEIFLQQNELRAARLIKWLKNVEYAATSSSREISSGDSFKSLVVGNERIVWRIGAENTKRCVRLLKNGEKNFVAQSTDVHNNPLCSSNI